MTLKDLTILQWQKDCSKTKMPADYVPKTKFSDKTANGLEKAICAYINLNGGMAERRKNSGRVIDDRKVVEDFMGNKRVLGSTRYIPGTGRNGTSDVSGIWKNKPIAIEVKIGKDRQSQAQKDYQHDFEKAGGIYIIAKDWNSFINEISKV